MQAYRTEIKISQDGRLTILGLPFRKGDIVEVIVLNQKQKSISSPYPLRGIPIGYNQPYDSVAGEDWENLK